MKAIILLTRRVLFVLLLCILLVMVSVALYEYTKVERSPIYNRESMPLNYEVIGSGERTLVLIHGLAGSTTYWKRDLASVTATHRVILIDLLGFGESPKPQSTYSLDVQVDAVSDVLLAAGLGEGKMIIAGHSLGSIVSLALLARHPEWFDRAVFIGLPVFASKDQFDEDARNFSTFDQLAVSRFGKFTCMLQPLYMVPWLQPADIPDGVFADAGKHTWQSYYYSLNTVVINSDLYALSAGIRDKNVTFIHGKKDRSAPFANAAAFAEVFTNKHFITLERGDHQLFLNDPEMVWDVINSSR